MAREEEDERGGGGERRERMALEEGEKQPQSPAPERQEERQEGAEKRCPFLLRCFWKAGRHNLPADYSSAARDVFPANQVQLYLWGESTLREVAEELRLVVVPALATTSFSVRNSKLDITSVFLNHGGRAVMKEVACVSLETESDAKKGESGSVLDQLGDAGKTLQQLNIRPGDFLDIAVLGEGRGKDGRDGDMTTSRSVRMRQNDSSAFGASQGRGYKRNGGRGGGGRGRGGGKGLYNGSGDRNLRRKNSPNMDSRENRTEDYKRHKR